MITGLQYASLSDIGEGFEEKRAPKGHRTPFGTIFIIANGMEGEESVETAGQKTIDLIKTTLRESDEISPSRALEQAFHKAHNDIWSDFKQKASLREQSYGLVAMLLTDEMAHIGHLGGSRVYLMRGETFARMKHTHDLAENGASNGAKGKEEKTYSMQLEPEDTFLLCSDGLSCPSDDSVIEQSLREDALYEAMRIFAEEDKASGIKDNTAIALIRIESLPVVFGQHTPVDQSEAPPLPGALKGGFDTETGDWIAFKESDVDKERLFAKLEDTWQDISLDLEKNKRTLAVTLATLKEEETPEDSLDEEILEVVGIFDEASLDAAFGLDEDDDNPFSSALRESLEGQKEAAEEAKDELPPPPPAAPPSQDDAPEAKTEEAETEEAEADAAPEANTEEAPEGQEDVEQSGAEAQAEDLAEEAVEEPAEPVVKEAQELPASIVEEAAAEIAAESTEAPPEEAIEEAAAAVVEAPAEEVAEAPPEAVEENPEPVPVPVPEAKAPPTPEAQRPTPNAQPEPKDKPAPTPVAPVQPARAPSAPAPSSSMIPMISAGLVALIVGLLIGFQVGGSGKGDLQNDVKTAEKRYLDTKSELEKLRGGETSAKQAIATAEGKVKALEKERDDLKQRLAAIKVNNTEGKLKALTDENEKLKKDLEEKKLELKNLRWNISKGNPPR